MIEQISSDNFLFHFGCKENEVNSKTLAATLLAFTEIIEEINRDLITGKSIEVRIKPFQAGSFDVPFDIIEGAIAGVLSEHAFSIPEIIKIYVELIRLKLNLKGEKPEKYKEIDTGIEISNNSGNITIVDKRTFNIYNKNDRVHNAFERQFDRLNYDPAIDDVELRSKTNESLIAVKREEFMSLLLRDYPTAVMIAQDAQADIVEDVFLNIFKIVFDANHKWEFFYKGNKIAAKIMDKEFTNKILSGERFANGDILRVQLRLKRTFDKIANTFVNKSFEIIKVEEHIPRKDQPDLLNLGQ